MEIENRKLKVAVLSGGISAEREVSIQSGNCVAEALKKAGLNIVISDIGPGKLDILEDKSIDVFFITLHGEFGEDGQLQQILEDKSLCYTGSGPAASRLSFDKLASKEHFIKACVVTPKVIRFDTRTEAVKLEKQLLELRGKFVVKPVRQGSAVGVTIADNPKSALEAAKDCFNKFGDCMIEEFIPGREITVGVLENNTLPIIEIKVKSDFYDYHAKYIDEQTEFLFDTITPELIAKINHASLNCFNSLGCQDFARVDLILGNDGIPYALEINTIPGFTEHSLLPKAAAETGISMSDLCIRIIDAALKKTKDTQNRAFCKSS